MCNIELKLSYERIDDASVLSNFFCGIVEMDNFIHKSLQNRIDRNDGLKLFAVISRGDIVAMTALKESTIEVHVPNNGKFSVDTLEIEYLAVVRQLQRNHIGKQIITWIEDTAVLEYPKAKYISVRAFIDRDIDYSAVPFYEYCGFRVIQKLHPMANNVKMAKKISNQ